MKAPLFVRTLSSQERDALEEALRSKDGFTLRRAQILRLSAEGQRPSHIAASLGCSVQTVRNALHAFGGRGIESLTPDKSGPKAPLRLFDEAARDRLMAIAHQEPRRFGRERSTWTLSMLAEVSFEVGLSKGRVSRETIRRAIAALGSSWQRAKHWIVSPDPQYALKKSKETA